MARAALAQALRGEQKRPSSRLLNDVTTGFKPLLKPFSLAFAPVQTGLAMAARDALEPPEGDPLEEDDAPGFAVRGLG